MYLFKGNLLHYLDLEIIILNSMFHPQIVHFSRFLTLHNLDPHPEIVLFTQQ